MHNPMQDPVEQRLLDYVAGQRDAIVGLCSRFIRTPSVNGVHAEAAIADVIADAGRALGLFVDRVSADPQRPNVIISTAADGPTGLLLLGHLDTVPAGDEAAWVYPPFAGTIADGRVYGRGAIDTKGGMAAALGALAALKAEKGALQRGRATLICVPDEETGATGTLGIKVLAERGLLEGLGAIYAYSGDELLLGHRGLLRYRLTCTGEAIHTGSLDWQERRGGANAVIGMARLLIALERQVFPPSAHPYFESYRTVITPGTVIQGGTGINIVPDRCEALVDIRLTPEHDLAFFTPRLEAAIADAARTQRGLSFAYEVLNFVPASISDETVPFFSVLEEVVYAVKGVRPIRAVAGPANEGYLLIERGIPTVCGMGPAGENAHAPNEYVEIQGLVEAAGIYALAARRLSALLE
jgi:acetylornithine deacetylase/succinyl-diaminopimelate desuccinylase-like protein